MPAFATRRCTAAWRSATRAAAASTAARSPTSQTSASAPISAASRRATASPIPLDPPVTTATRIPRGYYTRAAVPDFQGKKGLVLGVANRRSIAWAIAQRLAEGGAELAFTYQGERIEKGVRDLAETVGSPLVAECDVRSDESLDALFRQVGEQFGGKLDLLVHSVAFADARDLEGRFTDTPRDRFWLAVDVSAYSLVACARAAEPLMEAAGGGSILTMTYLGGERAVPHYNVMGVAKATLDASLRYLAWDLGEKSIRVNAVSAGPVRTLAARSIAGFPTMESIVEERAPLRRNIDATEVGAAAAFLLSDEAAGVTGTILYVDAGYHAMGM
jgi:enoyl-[acyl-carrier protein] reductase I